MQRKTEKPGKINNPLISNPITRPTRRQEVEDRLLATFGTEIKLFDVQQLITPDLFRLLIEPGKSWESHTTITYSFQIPMGDAKANEMMRHQPNDVDHTIALSPFPEFASSLTRKQLTWWQDATTLRFIETENNPMLYFFGFQPSADSDTLGFSMVGTDIIKHNVYDASIGISTELLKSANRSAHVFASTESTIAHEIGHGMIGFKHPFDPPFEAKSRMFEMTNYTIMAYDTPTIYGKSLVSITPMPADLDTAQYLYGRNWGTRRGSDIYQLLDFTPYDHPTIASLPWDAGGMDILSASKSQDSVLLDIRPYGKSKTRKGSVYTPNIQLENVIGGSGKTIIFLNEWNNRVDITHSPQSILYVDPHACGHDTIIGFDPKRDRIRVITPQTTEPAWQILPHPTMPNTTLVEFDPGHALELIGVSPAQFRNQTIVIDPSQVDEARALRLRKQEVDAALVSGFNLLNYQLSVDFLNAFGAGAGLTFIDTLTEESLTYYGVHPDKIHMTRKLIHALYIIMSGTILTNAPGLIASQFLSALGVSDSTSLLISSGITYASHIFSNLTPAGLARTAMNYAGSYAGSYFTLWARDKIKAALTPEPTAIKPFHPVK